MNGLDFDNPFVSAVHNFRIGEQAIDVAIDLLEHHEAAHDLTLVAPGLDYNCRPGVIEVTNDPRFGCLADPNDKLLSELIERHLFPFLSDTHAVLAPSYPDDCDSVFAGRYFFHGTARAVATTYAEWAKRERWLGTSKWHYTDLYYSQGLTEDVYGWIQALYHVVTEKCRRSLENSA
jgi:hypothetical protein